MHRGLQRMHRECNECAAACLREEEVKMMARCITLDVDCAAIWQRAVAAMARDSEHVTAICSLCGDICDSCADECSKHAMEHCQRCAEACKRSATARRSMALGASKN